MREEQEIITIEGLSLTVYRTGALIIGSGAASLSCAVHLQRKGYTDFLIVTDNRNGGTSRNTGSDKQTYYKLSDASLVPDSPYSMVDSYTRGGSVHGDIAFVEAQNSLHAFYNLVSLGMEFPHNKYGGYTGYKTDHDPSSRGTSLGPYTSKEMVRILNAEVDRTGIKVWNRSDVVRLLKGDDGAIAGAIVLRKDTLDTDSHGLTLVCAEHVVLGTGGPAGFYAASVYPRVHTGSIGLAMEIGAEASNLTESQFGIASVKFRWNLSGSYQQVLPRYYSTDKEGNDIQDFLSPHFDSWESLTQAVFLKGYQWPFDAAKIPEQGSSLIDLLVFHETQVKGRRVYIDFRENVTGRKEWGPFSRESVHTTALMYLENSHAWADSPLERLELLNGESIRMYATHGIHLGEEPLEIDVCAQHNNGGLAADIWWESQSVKHLYPIGEVNGSHGVSRPGGSALNAGQVGALRAAQRIIGYAPLSQKRQEEHLQACFSQVSEFVRNAKSFTSEPLYSIEEARDILDLQRKELQHRMSTAAGPIRSREIVSHALEEARTQQSRLYALKGIPPAFLPKILRLRHMMIAQIWYLFAIQQYLNRGGGSRGSFLVVDEDNPDSYSPLNGYNIKHERKEMRSVVQVIASDENDTLYERLDTCRAVPSGSFWFERVWKDFLSDKYFED